MATPISTTTYARKQAWSSQVVSPPSGSWGKGVFILNDTTPTQTELDSWVPQFTDGIFDDGLVIGTPTTYLESYGVVFVTGDGTDYNTRRVHRIDFFDVDSQLDPPIGPGISLSGSNCGADVYISTDTSFSTFTSTPWTYVDRFYPLNRQLWSGSYVNNVIQASGSIYRTQLIFGDGINTYQDCTAIKIHMFSGSLLSYSGGRLRIAELKAYITPTYKTISVSGSFTLGESITILPNQDGSRKGIIGQGTVIIDPPFIG